MPLLRKSLIAVAMQEDPGVDAVPTGASIIPVTGIDSYEPYAGDTTERTRMRDTLGSDEEINVAPYVSLQVTVPLYGPGIAGDVPIIAPLLRACGLREISYADSDADGARVEYLPVSEGFEMVTCYFYRDDRLQRITDARGTFSLNLATGSLPTIQVTLTGKYSRPESTTVTNPDFSEPAQEIPVNNQNTRQFKLLGRDLAMQSLSMDLGATVNWVDLVNYEGADYDDRATTGQVQWRAGKIADHNYFADIESHNGVTDGVLSLIHGFEAGNIVELAAPKVQLSGISDQDTNGRLYYQSNLRFLRAQGDDDFRLIFR